MGFWRAYVTCIQFPEVGLQRARPKRRLRGGDIRAKNDLRDDVGCSWNETFEIIYY